MQGIFLQKVEEKVLKKFNIKEKRRNVFFTIENEKWMSAELEVYHIEKKYHNISFDLGIASKYHI